VAARPAATNHCAVLRSFGPHCGAPFQLHHSPQRAAGTSDKRWRASCTSRLSAGPESPAASGPAEGPDRACGYFSKSPEPLARGQGAPQQDPRGSVGVPRRGGADQKKYYACWSNGKFQVKMRNCGSARTQIPVYSLERKCWRKFARPSVYLAPLSADPLSEKRINHTKGRGHAKPVQLKKRREEHSGPLSEEQNER